MFSKHSRRMEAYREKRKTHFRRVAFIEDCLGTLAVATIAGAPLLAYAYLIWKYEWN